MQQAAGMLSLRGCTSLLIRRADPTAWDTIQAVVGTRGESEPLCRDPNLYQWGSSCQQLLVWGNWSHDTV